MSVIKMQSSESCRECVHLSSAEEQFRSDRTKLEHELQYFKCLLSHAESKLEHLESKYNEQECPVEGAESQPKDFSLCSDYILSLALPKSFFSIVMNEDNSLCFLINIGIVSPSKDCSCGGEMSISKNETHFFYACPCGLISDLLEGSFWKGSRLTLDKILICIFMWTVNVKDKELSNLTGIPYGDVKDFTSKLRKVISTEFQDTFVKFTGIVEIDESCFRKNSRHPFKKNVEKWVFGLYERESKRCYMEVVEARTSDKLIPIIMKVCEPGTTIISDQWPAYNKLSDYGYPHYTVDHSRFFVDPHNREIHTQHIEISWGWAKYEIKRRSRMIRDLQEMLNEYCWKRQFRQCTKLEEMATIVKQLFQVIQKYRNIDFDK